MCPRTTILWAYEDTKRTSWYRANRDVVWAWRTGSPDKMPRWMHLLPIRLVSDPSIHSHFDREVAWRKEYVDLFLDSTGDLDIVDLAHDHLELIAEDRTTFESIRTLRVSTGAFNFLDPGQFPKLRNVEVHPVEKMRVEQHPDITLRHILPTALYEDNGTPTREALAKWESHITSFVISDLEGEQFIFDDDGHKVFKVIADKVIVRVHDKRLRTVHSSHPALHERIRVCDSRFTKCL